MSLLKYGMFCLWPANKVANCIPFVNCAMILSYTGPCVFALQQHIKYVELNTFLGNCTTLNKQRKCLKHLQILHFAYQIPTRDWGFYVWNETIFFRILFLWNFVFSIIFFKRFYIKSVLNDVRAYMMPSNYALIYINVLNWTYILRF